MKTISKEHIAIIQLRDAMDLYYDKNYISAITLSVAAEEILARLADEAYAQKMNRSPGNETKHNHADDAALLIARFIPYAGLENLNEEQKELMYKKIEGEYISKRNRLRNQLKHKNIGEEEVWFASFKKTAEEHISGAILNFQRYKGKLPEQEELIMKYCIEKGIS